jgi:lipopolysaccharide export system protein LptA
MRPLLLGFLLVVLAVPPVLGATDKTAPIDPNRIQITGDSFVVDDPHRQAIFSGHVLVTQAEMSLTADKVLANYGEQGASSIKTFEATGHVKIVTKEQTATGERAVYDPKTHLLTPTGNVLVTSASGTVQSSQLVVNVKKKTSTFSGGAKGGRVTGVFSTE